LERHPHPDHKALRAIPKAGERSDKPLIGAGSSFYETKWAIPFSQTENDPLGNSETQNQYPNYFTKEMRLTQSSQGPRQQPPKTKSEVVLGTLDPKQFMWTTTQLDYRDKYQAAEMVKPVRHSEDKEVWQTRSRGDEMQTTTRTQHERKNLGDSRRVERAGAPRTKLCEYNVVTGRLWPQDRVVGSKECYLKEKHF